MLTGICFIVISMFIYVNVQYAMIYVDGVRRVERKEEINRDRVYRYKILVSMLSFTIGVFRILSSIIY